MLTLFTLDTKASLLEGCHLSRKGSIGQDSSQQEEGDKSESHSCCPQQMQITPLQTGRPLGDTNTQSIYSCTYLLPIGLEEEVQRCV